MAGRNINMDAIENDRKLFVVGPKTCDLNTCCSLFSPFGTITDAVINGKPSKSKGRFIIAFSTKEEAEKALEGMNLKIIPPHERPFKLRLWAEPGSENDPTMHPLKKAAPKGIYIKVPTDFTRDKVKEIYHEYGDITWVSLEDPGPDEKRRVLIKFTRHSAAQYALEFGPQIYKPRWPKIFSEKLLEEKKQRRENRYLQQEEDEEPEYVPERLAYVRESPLSKCDHEMTSASGGYGQRKPGYGGTNQQLQQRNESWKEKYRTMTGTGQEPAAAAPDSTAMDVVEDEEAAGDGGGGQGEIDPSLYVDLPMSFTSKKAQKQKTGEFYTDFYYTDKGPVTNSQEGTSDNSYNNQQGAYNNSYNNSQEGAFGNSHNNNQRRAFGNSVANNQQGTSKSYGFQQQGGFQNENNQGQGQATNGGFHTNESQNRTQGYSYRSQKSFGSSQRGQMDSNTWQRGDQSHYNQTQNASGGGNFSSGKSFGNIQSRGVVKAYQPPTELTPLDVFHRDKEEAKLAEERRAAEEEVKRVRALAVINQEMAKVDDPNQEEVFVEARVPDHMTEEQATMLFDCAPGMERCKRDEKTGIVRITYKSEACAEYAVTKLDKLDYMGTNLKVTIGPMTSVTVLSDTADKLKETVAALKEGKGGVDAMNAILGSLKKITSQMTTKTEKKKIATLSEEVPWCSTKLPPHQPLAPPKTNVKHRLFFNLLPRRHSEHLLEDVFSRFAGFASISFKEDKNYGFAYFADEEGAELCRNTLQGARVADMQLHVEIGEHTPSASNMLEKSEDEFEGEEHLREEGLLEEESGLYTLPWCSVPVPGLQEMLPNRGNAEEVQVFIASTPKAGSATHIKNLCCRFGKFISFSWLAGQKYGFARFVCTESAKKCVETLNGAVVDEKTLTVGMGKNQKTKKSDVRRKTPGFDNRMGPPDHMKGPPNQFPLQDAIEDARRLKSRALAGIMKSRMALGAPPGPQGFGMGEPIPEPRFEADPLLARAARLEQLGLLGPMDSLEPQGGRGGGFGEPDGFGGPPVPSGSGPSGYSWRAGDPEMKRPRMW